MPAAEQVEHAHGVHLAARHKAVRAVRPVGVLAVEGAVDPVGHDVERLHLVALRRRVGVQRRLGDRRRARECLGTAGARRERHDAFATRRRWRRAEVKDGRGVQRHLCEAHQVDRQPNLRHALRRRAQQRLVDVEVPRARGDHHELKARARQVAVDVVLVERVEREVDGLEHVALVRVRQLAEDHAAADRRGVDARVAVGGRGRDVPRGAAARLQQDVVLEAEKLLLEHAHDRRPVRVGLEVDDHLVVVDVQLPRRGHLLHGEPLEACALLLGVVHAREEHDRHDVVRPDRVPLGEQVGQEAVQHLFVVDLAALVKLPHLLAHLDQDVVLGRLGAEHGLGRGRNVAGQRALPRDVQAPDGRAHPGGHLDLLPDVHALVHQRRAQAPHVRAPDVLVLEVQLDVLDGVRRARRAAQHGLGAVRKAVQPRDALGDAQLQLVLLADHLGVGERLLRGKDERTARARGACAAARGVVRVVVRAVCARRVAGRRAHRVPALLVGDHEQLGVGHLREAVRRVEYEAVCREIGRLVHPKHNRARVHAIVLAPALLRAVARARRAVTGEHVARRRRGARHGRTAGAPPPPPRGRRRLGRERAAGGGPARLVVCLPWR